MDALGKKAKALPSKTQSTARFHLNIYLATAQYLQANMFTLQLMPKVFKESAMPSKSINDVTGRTDVGRLRVLTAAERAELDNLKGQLSVLLEQVAQVESFIEDATKRRRFEDASSLKDSLEELQEEVERTRAKIGELESSNHINSSNGTVPGKK